MQELRDAIREEKDPSGEGNESGSGTGDETRLEEEEDEHGACRVYEVAFDMQTGEKARVHTSPPCTQSARRRAASWHATYD